MISSNDGVLKKRASAHFVKMNSRNARYNYFIEKTWENSTVKLWRRPMILWEEVGACAPEVRVLGGSGDKRTRERGFPRILPSPGLFWCVYLALQAVMTGLVLRIWRVLEWSPEKCLLRITISLPWAWWVQLWRLLRYGCRNLSRNWTTNYKHVTEGSPPPPSHTPNRSAQQPSLSLFVCRSRVVPWVLVHTWFASVSGLFRWRPPVLSWLAQAH